MIQDSCFFYFLLGFRIQSLWPSEFLSSFPGRFRLSAVNGLDPRTDDLTQISAGVHAQGHNTREETAELDKSENLERRKLDNAKHTVVDDKHLHDDRRGTQNLDIRCSQERQRIKAPDRRKSFPESEESCLRGIELWIVNFLPFNKLPALPAFLQFFLEVTLAVFGYVTAGKDVRNCNSQ